jgi:hypothetical protein
MADLYVSIVSNIAIFGTLGLLAASGVVLALPTAVALFCKYEPTGDEMILVRTNATDYDEDR